MKAVKICKTTGEVKFFECSELRKVKGFVVAEITADGCWVPKKKPTPAGYMLASWGDVSHPGAQHREAVRGHAGDHRGPQGPRADPDRRDHPLPADRLGRAPYLPYLVIYFAQVGDRPEVTRAPVIGFEAAAN